MKNDRLTKYTVFALMIMIIGLLYWGCSDDANPLPSKAHSKEWSNPDSEDFHGKKVAAVGYDYCAGCHGDDYTGGESKVSCFSCHETFPHPPEWMEISDPLFHGAHLVSGEGKVTDCKSCHGDDYKGGSSEVSCYKCHENYPHQNGWMDRSSENFHGAYLDNGGSSESCQGCHGVDYQGGSSGVSCNKCHSTYPHPDGWNTQNNDKFHGTFIINDDWQTTNCQACHGQDYNGGTSGISCYTCHTSYPHPDGWNAAENEKFHGKAVRDDDWKTESCESCHGADYSGGTSNVSCYTCHASFPHPSGWMAEDNAQFHGKAVSENEWDTESCQSCHGADYTGGSTNVSCYTCHASFPHPSGWMTESDNQFHGTVVREDDWKTESCQSCHGADYTGGPTNVSCYTCHASFPHPSGWMTENDNQFHGTVVQEDDWKTEGCQSCHGADYTGGTSKISCYTCHTTFPHVPGWMTESDAQFHGTVVREDDWKTESCQSCHGADYTGGSSNVSCYTCHASFPHPSGWMAQNDNQFHGTFVSENDWKTESCQSCHGVDYSGGTSNVSCYTCHATFPHPTGWMAEDDAQFHGKAVSDNNWNTQSCESCHGVDYTGGSSGVACYTCHANFPHTANWMAVSSSEFHGNYIRQDSWSMTSCKTCHGEDYRGGTTNSSCYTCHQGDAGPESCNVCHGNSEHNYPPEDLNKNTATTAMGVGAHAEHMELSFFTCDRCHVVPATFDAEGHIDPAPAEVNAQWTWDRTTGTCATSCHGGDLIWNNF